MKEEPIKNKKSNITLSLDKEILDEIKKDAKDQGISTNAKMNLVLSNYVMFGRYFAEKSAVILEPRIFSHLLNYVDEKRFLEMWSLVNAEIIPSVFARYNIPYTLDNIVNYSFRKMGINAGLYDNVTHHKESNVEKIVLEHKFGDKWSRILATAYSARLGKLINKKIETEVLPGTVVLKIFQ